MQTSHAILRNYKQKYGAFCFKQEKNEGFLTTARHGYKEGGHGVFQEGGEKWGLSPYPTTIRKCGRARIITVLVHSFVAGM